MPKNLRLFFLLFTSQLIFQFLSPVYGAPYYGPSSYGGSSYYSEPASPYLREPPPDSYYPLRRPDQYRPYVYERAPPPRPPLHQTAIEVVVERQPVRSVVVPACEPCLELLPVPDQEATMDVVIPLASPARHRTLEVEVTRDTARSFPTDSVSGRGSVDVQLDTGSLLGPVESPLVAGPVVQSLVGFENFT